MPSSTAVLGEHRAVNVTRNGDGTLTARLHAEWQYSQGYERSHLDAVHHDGERIDIPEPRVLENGVEHTPSRTFTDVLVEVRDGELHLRST